MRPTARGRRALGHPIIPNIVKRVEAGERVRPKKISQVTGHTSRVGGPVAACHARFRFKFVPAIGAAVRILQPLLDTVIAEDVLALGESKRSLVDALRGFHAELVVADDADCSQSASAEAVLEDQLGYKDKYVHFSDSKSSEMGTLSRDRRAAGDATILVVMEPRKS